MARNITGKKKRIYKYFGNKRKTRETVGPLWKERGDLGTQDMGKAEVLNDYFVSVFPEHTYSHMAQAQEGKGKEWENEELTNVGEDQVQDCLRRLKVHKSMGPDEMHLQVLRKLLDVVAKLPSLIFKKSWQYSEVPTHWKKGRPPFFKRQRKTWENTGQSVSPLCLTGS